MSQLGEAADPLPMVGNDKCPICEKAPHPDRTTDEKKEGKGCLKSIPANLGCAPLPPVPSLPNYTTAAHHIIPAIQCLAAFPRLSEMCKAVGYDVNNSANGISLPTCGQQALNRYQTSKGTLDKYGNLTDPEKRNVAFQIMDVLNLQWHVGHHNWVLGLDLDTDASPHPENYDKLVKRKLSEFERDAQREGGTICEPPDTSQSGSAVISEMNALSAEIRAQIVAWTLFYVSAKSYEFVQKCRL